MIMRFTNFFLILMGLSICDSYRILAIFPFNGRSHYHVLEPIAKALAIKGHQVDVMSNFKLKEPFPNYNELEFPTEESDASYGLSSNMSIFDWCYEQETRMCDYLSDPKISILIKNPPNDPAYDTILVHMLTGYQCFTGIGYIWNVPVIGVVTTTPWPPINTFIGNPLNVAISIDGYVDSHNQNLTFWERVSSFVRTYQFLRKHEQYRLRQEPFLKKHLDPNIPSYRELERNLALIFTNSHYTFHGIKPKTPALVEIGGINIQNNTSELDPSLKKLLDESDAGFIFFSFGTLMKLESLPQNVLNKFYSSFRKISPVKVIMRAKPTYTPPKNLSDNIFVFNWLPQQELLRHPNIKVFVTHGGGLSAQETINYAVPVICVPLFSEQGTNCDIFSLKNTGVQININTAEQADFDQAFKKVLTNSQYKESMKKFSKLYWDRPQSPQEAVNYWVEYVIRHGKNVLRSPALDLEWWQFELIDVYCYLFSCILVAIVLSIAFIIFLSKIIMLLCNSSKKIDSKKKFN